MGEKVIKTVEEVDSSATSRGVGIAMMLPLAGLIVYMVLNPKMWLIVLLAVVFSLMFNYGLKLLRGKTFKELGREVIDDINDWKEDVEEVGDRVRDHD